MVTVSDYMFLEKFFILGALTLGFNVAFDHHEICCTDEAVLQCAAASCISLLSAGITNKHTYSKVCQQLAIIILETQRHLPFPSSGGTVISGFLWVTVLSRVQYQGCREDWVT